MKLIKTVRVCDVDSIIYATEDDKLCVYNDNGYLHFQYKRNDDSIFSTYDYVEITSVLIGDNFTFDNDFMSIKINDTIAENVTISYERILISVLYGSNILDMINGNIDDVLIVLEKKFKRTINSLYTCRNIKDVRVKFMKKMNIAVIYEFLLHKAIL